ncbi:hypothetical protein N2152v2_001906 [Parachlorella kessleri]
MADGRLFPHQEMYKWLVYGNDSKHPQADNSFFPRREFCFTLEGDIFVRYQSFKDCQDMQAAINSRCPAKIDIGPVYNVDPQRRSAYTGSSSGFCPVERELVFDIDLTDYDDVRTCGKEGHICSKCWPLMAAAIKILDRGLREDFGFQHILFVYSGRRGVHCWVCDDRARKLSDEQRSAVANYFAVYKGQEKGLVKLGLGPNDRSDHPAITQAYEILEAAFEQHILPEQRLLEDSTQAEAVLGYVPSDFQDLKQSVQQQWASGAHSSSMDDTEGGGESQRRWQILKAEVDGLIRKLQPTATKDSKNRAGAQQAISQLSRCLKEIVFAYAYPRLDMEVSKKMNHLLKAPFCVHPKTGKVCVPIDPELAWEFDPDAVPTVAGLLGQLNSSRGSGSSGSTGEDWRSTDMAAAVDTFHSCFLDVLQAEARSNLAAKAREAAAAPTLAW